MKDWIHPLLPSGARQEAEAAIKPPGMNLLLKYQYKGKVHTLKTFYL